jgi:hypothetical protein
MQIWMKGFGGSITSCQEVGNAAQPSKARPGAVNAQVLEGPSQGRTGDNQDWRAPYHQRTGASSVISGMLDRSRGLVGRHSKAGRSGWEPHVCNYRCGGLIRDPSRPVYGFTFGLVDQLSCHSLFGFDRQWGGTNRPSRLR